MFAKQVKFFGNDVVLVCDGNCTKAWGINTRPRRQLSADEDDYEFKADHELARAPIDPGTYEGGHAKPIEVVKSEQMNKWCARECERCSIVDLKTFAQPLKNIGG